MSSISVFYALCRESGLTYTDAQDYLRIAGASRGSCTHARDELTGSVAVELVLGDIADAFVR